MIGAGRSGDRVCGTGGDAAVPGSRAYGRMLTMNDGGRGFLKIMAGFENTAEFEARILPGKRLDSMSRSPSGSRISLGGGMSIQDDSSVGPARYPLYCVSSDGCS